MLEMQTNVGVTLDQVAKEVSPASASITSSILLAIDRSVLPLGPAIIEFLFSMYNNFNFFTVVIILIKYLPTALYTFKVLKNRFTFSKEWMQMKQMEIENTMLQIQIVNTKLCVREAEYSERREHFRRKAERLRALRSKVRHIITTDDDIFRILQIAPAFCMGRAEELPAFPQEENDFILTMLNDLEGEQSKRYEHEETNKKEERTQEQPTEDRSPYSSVLAPDEKDCRLKIVKVTNVYRVAYKHCIKQKQRGRRSSQNYTLQRKIESIQELLESWQKKLNAVLYSKMIVEGIPVDLASQEAMGDYSKPSLREFSDSDSELKATEENCYDDWSQNSCEYNYNSVVEEGGDTRKLAHEPRDYCEGYDEGAREGPAASKILFVLPEETSSQIAIAEKSDDPDP